MIFRPSLNLTQYFSFSYTKGRTNLEMGKQTLSSANYQAEHFSVALFLSAQLFAQPTKSSELIVCLPISRFVRPLATTPWQLIQPDGSSNNLCF